MMNRDEVQSQSVSDAETIHFQCPRRFDAVPPPLPACPWRFVATPAALRAAITALSAAACIAVDIEHNASRSYLGLTCLVTSACYARITPDTDSLDTTSAARSTS